MMEYLPRILSTLSNVCMCGSFPVVGKIYIPVIVMHCVVIETAWDDFVAMSRTLSFIKMGFICIPARPYPIRPDLMYDAGTFSSIISIKSSSSCGIHVFVKTRTPSFSNISTASSKEFQSPLVE